MNPANLLDMLLENRALLAVAALRKMQRLDDAGGSRYHRKIDFQRVALIGHSRGGDAVVRALRLTPSNTRARAGAARADRQHRNPAGDCAHRRVAGASRRIAGTGVRHSPRHYSGNRIAKAADHLGSRDGDVSGMEDVRSDVSVNPFRHYDRSAVERAFQFCTAPRTIASIVCGPTPTKTTAVVPAVSPPTRRVSCRAPIRSCARSRWCSAGCCSRCMTNRRKRHGSTGAPPPESPGAAYRGDVEVRTAPRHDRSFDDAYLPVTLWEGRT